MEDKIEISLTSKNKDSEEVTFQRKSSDFLESFRMYVNFLKFGSQLANLGLLEPTTRLPSFEGTTKETLRNIRSRFTAYTKAAIRKHEVFGNPNVLINKYERTASYSQNPDFTMDLSSLGRYKLDILIKAKIDIGSDFIRLDKREREYVIENFANGWINYNGQHKTHDRVRIFNIIKKALMMYEVFLIDITSLYNNSTRSYNYPEIAKTQQKELNDSLNPFLSNIRSSCKLLSCVVLNSTKKGKFRFIDSGSKACHLGFTTIDGLPFEQYIFNKYLRPQYKEQQYADKDFDRVKSIGTSVVKDSQVTLSHADYHLMSALLSNMEFVDYGGYYYSPMKSTDKIRDKPFSDTCFITGTTNLNQSVISLSKNYALMLAFRNSPDTENGKPYVDITRHDLHLICDFVLSSACTDDASRFVAAHNVINDKLKELVDGKPKSTS